MIKIDRLESQAQHEWVLSRQLDLDECTRATHARQAEALQAQAQKLRKELRGGGVKAQGAVSGQGIQPPRTAWNKPL